MPPGWREVARNAKPLPVPSPGLGCPRAPAAPPGAPFLLSELLQRGINPSEGVSAAAGCRRGWQRWVLYFFNFFFF